MTENKPKRRLLNWRIHRPIWVSGALTILVVIAIAAFLIQPRIDEVNATSRLGDLGYGSHGGNWIVPDAVYFRLPNSLQRYFVSTQSIASGDAILSDDELAVLASFPNLRLLHLNALTDRDLFQRSMDVMRFNLEGEATSPPQPEAGKDGWILRNGYELVCPHQFTDRGLSVVNRLHRLESLELRFANLTDAGMPSLASLLKLNRLDLKGTKITDAGLAHLVDLTNLEFLDLRDTDVRGSGFRHLARLNKLREFKFPFGCITDETAEYVGELTGLKTLDFGSFDVSDVGVEQIRSLMGLEELHLWSPIITEDCLRHLAGMQSLKSLRLCCKGHSEIGTALVHLGGLLQLKELTLQDMFIGTEGWKFLPLIKSLHKLDCDFSTLNREAGSQLARCPELEELWLRSPSPTTSVDSNMTEKYFTPIAAAFFVTLAHASRLRTLTLTRASFSDVVVDGLSQCKSLKVLELHEPLLSDEQLARLKAALPNCRIDDSNRKSLKTIFAEQQR